MTIVIIDKYSCTTDTEGTHVDDVGNVSTVFGVRKIFHCEVINDYFRKDKFTPLNCIAFSGSALGFLEWLEAITTDREVIGVTWMTRKALEVEGDFTVYMPAVEGVIRMKKKGRNILMDELPWRSNEDIFVFGGAAPEERYYTNKVWFQNVLDAYNKGYLKSLLVDRFVYSEGFVHQTKVLDEKEALEQKKQRRRPWGAKKFLSKRK